MAYLNHPLLGDTLYNSNPGDLIKRQALHSYKMKFIHPISKKKFTLTAPLPEDMLDLILKK